MVTDRARVVGVEGVRADGRLRPGAHRLRHDHAAAVAGDEDAPRTRRRGQHLLQQQGLRVGEPLPVRRLVVRLPPLLVPRGPGLP